MIANYNISLHQISLYQFQLTVINDQDTIPAGAELKVMTPGDLSPLFPAIFTNVSAVSDGPSNLILTDIITDINEN